MPSHVLELPTGRELNIIVESDGTDVLVYRHGTPAAGRLARDA